MGRKENRLAAALERNPIVECNRVRNKYIPNFMEMLSETADPRNLSYVTYSNRTMLSTMIYKDIGGIESMQQMSVKFNKKEVVDNLYTFSGEPAKEFLPHHVTENEYLERLQPGELQGVLQKICYDSIRRKSFNDARFRKKWLVIVDATRTYSGSRKINESCLETCFNRGTDEEIVIYHQDVLEAKIYLGEGLLLSIGSEFLENDPEQAKKRAEMSEEAIKQDCERKAFYRLAEKIKKVFPRLPIILLADSLYACGPVMDICEKNGWDYIIRYKAGSIPSLAEDYESIPEKGKAGHAEFVNDLEYKGHLVNILRYRETKVKKGEEITTLFQWLTSVRITERNAEKAAQKGRLRWKIENEGFNRQKNWQGNLTHACSHNANALKNHYLIQQIADFIKQLYEWYYLKRMGIQKKQKNISSELLASFGRQLTAEDISTSEQRSAVPS